MKVLIGMNPKGHAHLGMDELNGLNKLGLQCKAISYGRRDFSVKGPVARLLETIGNSFRIISTLYKFAPDILYLNSRLEPVASIRDFVTVFLIKCCYFRKLKIAIKSHGSDLTVLRSTSFLYRRIIIPWLTRHVDLWFFLSHQEATIVSKHNPVLASKIVITCNIIEPSRLIPDAEFKKKYNLEGDRFKILFIGRVIEEKGVFEFLKAIPLVDRKDECDFILVGDGADLWRLKRLAGELGVASHVRFLGWVDIYEADSFYGGVDMLVFPTFFGEGFPMALFNSIASGLPVITTRTRAAIDHLTMPDNVIWVEHKNEQQVADAINELVRNDELRRFMSYNNKRLAARFSQERVCAQMSAAFMSLNQLAKPNYMSILIKSLKKVRNELLRNIKYRRYTIGKGFSSGIRVRLWAKRKLIIGKNFYIGRDALIETDAIIGDNVMIGNRAAIIGKYDHNFQQVGTPIRHAVQMRDRNYDWKGIHLTTVIENDVMVGHGSTIYGGVKIGEGSIIAATSLVTRDVEPYSIYAGSPARKVKDRFDTAEDLHKHLELVKSKYCGVL